MVGITWTKHGKWEYQKHPMSGDIMIRPAGSLIAGNLATRKEIFRLRMWESGKLA